MFESLKDRIKNKLTEAIHYFDDEDAKDRLRIAKTKVLNLKHVGHGTYKNPVGHEFTWDDSKADFILTKRANVVSFPKKDIFNNPPPGGWKDHDRVDYEGEKPLFTKQNGDPVFRKDFNNSVGDQSFKTKNGYEIKKGTKIHYTGDQANIPGEFEVTDVKTDVWYKYKIQLKEIGKNAETKTRFEYINPLSLDGNIGRRFIPKEEYDKDRAEKMKEFEKQIAKIQLAKQIPSYDPDEISGDPDSYVDKDLQSGIKSFASKFKEAIAKYHKQSGYDGEVFDQDKKVNIKYKNKWANIDHGKGSGRFMVALDDIVDRNGNPVASKGDVREIKAYGVPNHRWKLGNVLTGTYKANFHGGSFESDKKLDQIKDTIKAKLEEPNTGYEVDDVSDNPNEHRNGKLISKNWGLRFRDTYGDITFEVYETPENIGKRGKTVKETYINAHLHNTEQMGRTAWGPTIFGRIKSAKPKTPKELIAFIQDEFSKMKAEEPKAVIREPRETEHKGIDSHSIPDFGLEGEYKDFSGKDINVDFKKPTIKISSKKRVAQEKGDYNSGIDVKWNYAKKLKKIEDQLKNAETEAEIIKLLNNNGIKYRSYMYSTWD